MLFRKKPEAAESMSSSPEAGASAATSRPGKGRPTPKRRDAEAARRRPLVADTKTMTKEQKGKRRHARAVAREGMLRGEDKYLAARDRGPERRYLRDAVDRRWNIGEILLPTMLLILTASLVGPGSVQLLMFAAAYGTIAFGLLDAYLLWRRTKIAFIDEFHQDPPKRAASYVVLRSFQMRMSRVPRAQVTRGDTLRRR